MKNQFLLFSLSMICCILFSCDVNISSVDDDCYLLDFRQNGCKEFFPYSNGQKLTFKDSQGNEDILTVQAYELTPIDFVRDNCTTRTESFLGAFSLQYKTSNMAEEERIDVNLWSETDMELPYFEITSDANFYASFNGLGNGIISRQGNFEFNGKTYDSILKVTIEDENQPIEEFVLAKDYGLLYFKIDGEVREVLE